MMLKYVGDGKYIMGIPARDLSDDEIDSLRKERGQTKTQFIKEITRGGLYFVPAREKNEPKDGE
ncbi:MAG: hypothetical protein AAF126_03055 [Chloroflexota bacterium]